MDAEYLPAGASRTRRTWGRDRGRRPARLHAGRGHQLARGRRAARGGGRPAVFDRYSNSFIKIYFSIPEGREDEIARKVLVKHLQSGNSYGIQLKEAHTKFPQPQLGPWVKGSATVGTDWKRPVLEGWEPPEGH